MFFFLQSSPTLQYQFHIFVENYKSTSKCHFFIEVHCYEMQRIWINWKIKFHAVFLLQIQNPKSWLPTRLLDTTCEYKSYAIDKLKAKDSLTNICVCERVTKYDSNGKTVVNTKQSLCVVCKQARIVNLPSSITNVPLSLRWYKF